MLNGERAAMSAPVFFNKLVNARKQLLTNIVNTEYPEEEEESETPPVNSPSLASSRRVGSLTHFSASSGASNVISVSVTSADLIYKSGVDADSKVKHLIERMEKKLPPSLTGYSLWLEGLEMDENKTMGHYRSDVNKQLDLEIKPRDHFKASSPTMKKNRSFSSKTFSVRSSSKKNVYSLMEAFREESKTPARTTSEDSTIQVAPPVKELQAVEVLSVNVKTPSMEISTKVPSTSKLSELFEKMRAKFPNDPHFQLAIEGKIVDLSKTLNDYRKDTDQKTMNLEFGPPDFMGRTTIRARSKSKK